MQRWRRERRTQLPAAHAVCLINVSVTTHQPPWLQRLLPTNYAGGISWHGQLTA